MAIKTFVHADISRRADHPVLSDQRVATIQDLHPRNMTGWEDVTGTSYIFREDRIAILQDAEPIDRFRNAIGQRVGASYEFESVDVVPDGFDTFLGTIIDEPTENIFIIDRKRVRIDIGYSVVRSYYFSESAAQNIIQYFERKPFRNNPKNPDYYSLFFLSEIAKDNIGKNKMLARLPSDARKNYLNISDSLFRLALHPELLPDIDYEQAEVRHEYTHKSELDRHDGAFRDVFDTHTILTEFRQFETFVETFPEATQTEINRSISRLRSISNLMRGLLESEAMVFEVLGAEPRQNFQNNAPETLMLFTRRIAGLLSSSVTPVKRKGESVLDEVLFSGNKYSSHSHDFGTLVLLFPDTIVPDSIRTIPYENGFNFNQISTETITREDVISVLEYLMINPDELCRRIQNGLLVSEALQTESLKVYLTELEALLQITSDLTPVIRPRISSLAKKIAPLYKGGQ